MSWLPFANALRIKSHDPQRFSSARQEPNTSKASGLKTRSYVRVNPCFVRASLSYIELGGGSEAAFIDQLEIQRSREGIRIMETIAIIHRRI
jgi:hypothetical protein